MIISQKKLEQKFMELAFKKAYENLGSAKENPSVGCVVVKNNAVISSGVTSVNGRPHAEINALKTKKNFSGADMYITLEPCSHYGKTPPCVRAIFKNKIKKVYYPISDPDIRTHNKALSYLKRKKIIVQTGLLKKEALKFYKSYFISKENKTTPYIDAKIAISKDYFSKNIKKKWITNDISRTRGHLIRSKYDCILTTYKSVNKDNSILNCRINGIEHLSPSRVIIDRNLRLKKKLDIYNSTKKIKTYVVTNKANKTKENFLKSKNIKIIKIKNTQKNIPYANILMELKKRGFSRILCESGFFTTQALIKNNLIHNLYVFMSRDKLGRKGKNSFKTLLSKLRLKNKKKININLFGDELYKFIIK